MNTKNLLNFFVEGLPKAKARPRVVSKGGRVWSFTPKSSIEWAEIIKYQVKSILPVDFTPVNTPLCGCFVFHLPRSKSNKAFFHTKKPDLDNLEKGVMDALNGLVFLDDKQFVIKHGIKQYSNNVGVNITICELII